MKEKDKELTRSHIQKSICVLSEIPFFGSIMNKVSLITHSYFNQKNFQDKKVNKIELSFFFNV